MIIYIIVGVVVAVFAGGYFWYNKGVKTEPKILEYRDFSCPGMTGFTFKYPVFEGWTAAIKKSDELLSSAGAGISCSIIFSSGFETILPMKVVVNQVHDVAFKIKSDLPKNLNGVTYSISDDNKQVNFYYSGQYYTDSVMIKNENIDDISEDGISNFSNKIFFKTMIDSFKLISLEESVFAQLVTGSVTVMNVEALYDSGFKVNNTDDAKKVFDTWASHLKEKNIKLSSDQVKSLSGSDLKLTGILSDAEFVKGQKYWGVQFSYSQDGSRLNSTLPVAIGENGKVVILWPAI
jgi:hypothetical protein